MFYIWLPFLVCQETHCLLFIWPSDHNTVLPSPHSTSHQTKIILDHTNQTFKRKKREKMEDTLQVITAPHCKIQTSPLTPPIPPPHTNYVISKICQSFSLIVFTVTKRYAMLCQPSFSFCRGLWPLAEVFLPFFGQNKIKLYFRFFVSMDFA